MRRTSRLIAALLLLVLTVAACGADPDPEPEPPAVTVSGSFDRTPVVSIDAPLELAEVESTVVLEGEGRALEDGGPALLALSAYDGQTGEMLADRGAGEARTLRLTPEEVGQDVYPLLLGTAEGTRLLVTQPVSTDDDERMLVLVIDVLHTVAQGEEVEVPDSVPAAEQDDDGVTITLPDGDPPGTLAVDTVVRGTGPQVEPGQQVTVQYVAATWPGGEIYDSTWADGQVPRTVVIDETFAGLRDGLVDQAVGSRVVIVVPPALGTGTQTLVFAVDILAVSSPEQDPAEEPTPEPVDTPT